MLFREEKRGHLVLAICRRVHETGQHGVLGARAQRARHRVRAAHEHTDIRAGAKCVVLAIEAHELLGEVRAASALLHRIGPALRCSGASHCVEEAGTHRAANLLGARQIHGGRPD